MAGGMVISSNFFDENSNLSDFNYLKFILASEIRLKLLLSLYESNKTIKELETRLLKSLNQSPTKNLRIFPEG